MNHSEMQEMQEKELNSYIDNILWYYILFKDPTINRSVLKVAIQNQLDYHICFSTQILLGEYND